MPGSAARSRTIGSSIGSVDTHPFPEQSGEHHEHDESMMEPLDHTHMQVHEHHDQKMGPVAGFSTIQHHNHSMTGRDGNDMPTSSAAIHLPPPPMMRRGDSGVPEPPGMRRSNSGVPEPPRLLSRISSRTVNNDMGMPVCSEFGLRSLNRTAQSVGLSLDELALVLSSTENLAEKLGISNDNNDGPVGV